jgi:hypothetical protein
VPTTTRPSLSASGDRLVYAVSRTIRVLDLRTGRTSRAAVAAATPVGLSLSGRRVAWAENLRRGSFFRGRVRAVTLPG